MKHHCNNFAHFGQWNQTSCCNYSQDNKKKDFAVSNWASYRIPVLKLFFFNVQVSDLLDIFMFVYELLRKAGCYLLFSAFHCNSINFVHRGAIF